MSNQAHAHKPEHEAAHEVAAAVPAAAKAKSTTYNTVKMTDGSLVEFAGKRKMLKTSTIHEDGSITVRLDFSNGEFRIFKPRADMLPRFAAHGAEQKLGDEIAGLDDLDDCILAIDELVGRLTEGNWGITRDSNGMAGTSVLARALSEHSKKDISEVKAFLAGKSQAQKVALRTLPALVPIIARLESEKVRKAKVVVDTSGMLDELADFAMPAAHAHAAVAHTMKK